MEKEHCASCGGINGHFDTCPRLMNWDGINNNLTLGRLGEPSPEETLTQESDAAAEASHRDLATSPGVGANRQTAPDPRRHGKTKRIRKVGTATESGGIATAEIQGPGEGFEWEIERIFFNAPAGSADVFVSQVGNDYQVDFATSAVKAVADQNHPIYVPERQSLFVRFNAPGAGVNCLVTIQGKEIPREV